MAPKSAQSRLCFSSARSFSLCLLEQEGRPPRILPRAPMLKMPPKHPSNAMEFLLDLQHLRGLLMSPPLPKVTRALAKYTKIRDDSEEEPPKPANGTSNRIAASDRFSSPPPSLRPSSRSGYTYNSHHLREEPPKPANKAPKHVAASDDSSSPPPSPPPMPRPSPRYESTIAFKSHERVLAQLAQLQQGFLNMEDSLMDIRDKLRILLAEKEDQVPRRRSMTRGDESDDEEATTPLKPKLKKGVYYYNTDDSLARNEQIWVRCANKSSKRSSANLKRSIDSNLLLACAL